MRKGTKITLLVIGIIVAVLCIGIMSADIWASRAASKAVQSKISDDPTTTTYMSIGNVHVLLMSGCVEIDDVYLTSDSSVVKLQDEKLQTVVTNNKTPGMAVYVPKVVVSFINYIRLLRNKELRIFDISVYDPQMIVYLDEKHPENCLPKVNSDSDVEMDEVTKFMKLMDLSSINVIRANAELKSVRTKLNVKVDSLSACANDLMFNLLDSAFTYNDSIYSVELKHLYMKLDDGSADLSLNNLRTEDAGPLMLGKTRFRNLIDAVKMAEKEKDYVTWVDISVKRVETSAFNPIHKALAQDWTLDSIYADVEKLHVVRDQHINPNRRFPTPQEVLMKIPAKFAIKNVAANVNKVHIDFTLDAVNYGKMDLAGLSAKMKNVSNRTNTVWTNHVRGTLGGDSRLEATFVMHMNKAANFDVSITGTNAELNTLNTFLQPIVGLSCDSHVDTLRTHYSGDKDMAKGDFLMMYHGLNVQFHKDQDIAVKEIRNFGGLIEGFANNLVPKSNPTVVDVRPRKYAVEWKHDEYKPYPLFVVGPVIIGVVETMLPGLYVHKQIREK